MSKVFVPTASADAWKQFLAEPAKQWKSGFSAKTLAHCWEDAAKQPGSLPREIAAMLLPHGGDPELLLALPEYKVALPGSSRGESQNDIFALARVGDRTFAIMVEGKVREPFGDKIGDWLKGASNGKRERLTYLCQVLGFSQPPPDQTRYQLLHRTASAVIEAQRFKTDAAAMIVHSFSREKLWFNDFVQFSSLFGAGNEVKASDALVAVRSNGKPTLFLGWASGDYSYLEN